MPRYLAGGSAAKLPSFRHAFFKESLTTPVLQFKAEKPCQVIILPSFDYTIPPSNPNFARSYVPYRDPNVPLEGSTEPGFSPFDVLIDGHLYLGTKDHPGSFLSPQMLHPTKSRGLDPINDLYWAAKRHKDPTIRALIEKPPRVQGAGFSPILETSKTYFVMNVLHLDQERVTNKVLLMTMGARKTLTDAKLGALNYLRPATVNQIISPAWPQFLYGDVTDPATAAVASVRHIDTNGFSIATFFFSESHASLKGYHPFVYNPTSPEGAAYLAGRVNIRDADNVYNIPDPQEMVDFLVGDMRIPYEFIKETLGESSSWVVGPRSSRPVVSTPTGPVSPSRPPPAASLPAAAAAVANVPPLPVKPPAPVKPLAPTMPAAQVRPSAPAMPSMPSFAPPPPPLPPPPPATVWLAIPGENMPREVLVDQVPAWAAAHPQLQVLSADRKTWGPVAAYLASRPGGTLAAPAVAAVSPFETAEEAGVGTPGAGDPNHALRLRYSQLTDRFVNNPEDLTSEEHAELLELGNQLDGLN